MQKIPYEIKSFLQNDPPLNILDFRPLPLIFDKKVTVAKFYLVM